MENKYFSTLEFDEPQLFDKDIKCAFYISRIDNSHGYFFIVEENEKYFLYYSIPDFNGLVKLAKELNYKDKTIIDLFSIPGFIDKYNELFVQKKVITDQEYVRKSLIKMYNDNIGDADNSLFGLDGFSVELKLKKSDKAFISSCDANDSKYFYVLDFINFILDDVNVNPKYRFRKYVK